MLVYMAFNTVTCKPYIGATIKTLTEMWCDEAYRSNHKKAMDEVRTRVDYYENCRNASLGKLHTEETKRAIAFNQPLRMSISILNINDGELVAEFDYAKDASKFLVGLRIFRTEGAAGYHFNKLRRMDYIIINKFVIVSVETSGKASI